MDLPVILKSTLKGIFFLMLDACAFFFVRERPLPGRGNEIERILVFEGGGIGDLLRIFPAIEALHANFPHASISLLASPHSQGVLSLFRGAEILSEVIDYDIRGKHRRWLAKLGLIASLRRRNFHLAYSPSRGEGMREHLLLSFLTGARHRIGFRIGRCGLLNTVRIEFQQGDVPIARQNLDLLHAAHLKTEESAVRLAVPEKERNAAVAILQKLGFIYSYPLVAVHAGAFWNARYRCWPIEKYISLIGRLLREVKAQIILVGSDAEAEAGERIEREIRDTSVVSLAGKTDIPLMAAVIGVSHIFIGNDSGPLHIASALKIPFIGIFGSTAPGQVLSHTHRGIILRRDMGCGPCYLHDPLFTPSCERTHQVPPCLDMITVEEVMEGVKRLLMQNPVKGPRVSSAPSRKSENKGKSPGRKTANIIYRDEMPEKSI